MPPTPDAPWGYGGHPPGRWAIERAGDSEPLKGLVHEAMLGLSSAAALYNLAAWSARREPRLLFNAFFYAALACFEAAQAARHRY